MDGSDEITCGTLDIPPAYGQHSEDDLLNLYPDGVTFQDQMA